MPNYKPTDEDILRVRVRSTGIEEAEFDFDDMIFNMIDVGGQRSERRKWIHCFDKVDAILFVASLSCYDQFLREDSTQNAMIETMILFQEVVNSEYFPAKRFILFLNKVDLFERKMPHVPLSEIFEEYTGGDNIDAGINFIGDKFLNVTTRVVTLHVVCALSSKNLKLVIKSVKAYILKSILDQVHGTDQPF